MEQNQATKNKIWNADVPWEIFIWSCSIVVAILGVLFWQVEGVRQDVTAVKITQAVEASDISYIKQTFEAKGSISQK